MERWTRASTPSPGYASCATRAPSSSKMASSGARASPRRVRSRSSPRRSASTTPPRTPRLSSSGARTPPRDAAASPRTTRRAAPSSRRWSLTAGARACPSSSPTAQVRVRTRCSSRVRPSASWSGAPTSYSPTGPSSLSPTIYVKISSPPSERCLPTPFDASASRSRLARSSVSSAPTTAPKRTPRTRISWTPPSTNPSRAT